MHTIQSFIEQHWHSWINSPFISNHNFKHQVTSFFKSPYIPTNQQLHKAISSYAHKQGFSFFPDKAAWINNSTIKGKLFIKGTLPNNQPPLPNKIIFQHSLSDIIISITNNTIIITTK